MAAQPEVPLEEITWRSPQHVQMMGGFLHSNNILFYFAESPFFDQTSNNASLAIQASYNEAFRPFIETREAFEGRLKTMQGLEFMVAHDPIQEAAAAAAASAKGAVQKLPQEPSNIWVIRKQTRRKRGALNDEVLILDTYFVVGDSVYMAPSVWGVLGSRMLSTVTSLTKALSTASPLPLFSPSHGHTYTPPVPKSLEESQTGQQSTQQSTANTPAPDTQTTQSKAGISSSLGTSATFDERTLAEAFNLFSRYGDEYMDEAPLVGEPGSFIISKKPTTAAPTTTAESASRQPGKSASSTPAPGGKPGTPAVATPTQPPALKTDAATITAAKASKGAERTPTTPGGREKLKRKKGKVGSMSS